LASCFRHYSQLSEGDKAYFSGSWLSPGRRDD
jgi:hypothetical protein